MKIERNFPEWWPKNPYPEDIFSTSIEEWMIQGPELRKAVSATLARFFWETSQAIIFDKLVEQGILKNENK